MFTKTTIERYFFAEKHLQLLVLLLGMSALLLAAIFFFYGKTQKAKGAAIVLLIGGFFLSIMGFVAYEQNDALRLQQIHAFDMNPISLKNIEQPRIQRYLQLIIILHSIGFVMALLGLGTYVFTRFKKNYKRLQGAAIVTLIMSCMVAGMSYLSYDNTHHYLFDLKVFSTKIK
jgi:ABC-type enterochelin transport system permease subunit